jgi:ATP-binding cassette subfamily B protein
MSAPSVRSYSVTAVLRTFVKHGYKYRWFVLFIVLGTLLGSTIINVVLPYIAKLLFDTLASSTQGAAALGKLEHTLLLFTLASLALWVCQRGAYYLLIYVQPRMMADLEQAGFSYLIHHSYQFFQNNFSGSLVRKVSKISRAYQDIIDVTNEQLLPIIVSFIGILVVLFRRNSFIGWIVFVWLIVMTTYNFFYSRWKAKHDVRRAEQDSHLTGFLADAISNVLTIKLFAATKREEKGFRDESNLLRDMRYKAWMTHIHNYTLQALILVGLQATVLWLGIHYWSEGKISAGDVVLFQSYFSILYSRVLDFSRMLRSYYTSFADATELVEILDQPHEIKDARGAKALRVTRGELVFDQVKFSYGAGSVLNDFDLKIQPGEKIALVGTSGAGKSTIVKLLFRFYDLTSGAITVDGQNIKNVTQDSLRGSIALVPQEPILFHRSLFENIRYGKPDATEKDVMKAAKLAHCHEFIEKLPQGYETQVGERGVKLSGGERQRVAIARAILKNAPILVLDEATSSLDSESEGLIQDALRSLMRGKTTIVIAHRLSTIMSMDRIVIMDQGKVADTGTHTELLQKTGIYQKLWNLQVGGFFQE